MERGSFRSMIPAGGMEKPLSDRRGLEIRSAGGGDAAGLSALLADAGFASTPVEMAGRLESVRHRAGAVLIALDWGPPTGVVALHWFASLRAARPVAQVDMLLVGMEDRRRGIGRLLLKAAAQAARVAGCGEIVLTGDAGQSELRAFCLATGFVETGCRFGRALRKSAG